MKIQALTDIFETNCGATYQQLCVMDRRRDLVWIDETCWRVAAHLQWLWAAVTEKFTVYQILPGRGFDQAAQILGGDYSGFLNHDALRFYYGFLQTFHQASRSPAASLPGHDEDAAWFRPAISGRRPDLTAKGSRSSRPLSIG